MQLWLAVQLLQMLLHGGDAIVGHEGKLLAATL